MATIDVNGASLVYDDAGAGAPPMLFVHGWAGNRRNFAPQVAFFAPTHRVVALDRRGHGESSAPREEYTVEAASDDLAAVCRHLGLDRALVVQHSYDRIGVDFAVRHPDQVLALALLDTPTLAGPEWQAGATAFLAGLESDHWQDAIRAFAEQAVFPPGLPEPIKAAALAELFATPYEVLVSSWRHFLDYRLEDALAELRCPLLHVGGAFPADTDRLRTICPQLETAEVRGAGHFIQLTAPEAVNAILAGFAARAAATATTASR